MAEDTRHAEHTPKPIALVLCDTIARDPATNKFNILGTFDSLSASAFPAVVKLSVYAVITDCIGKHEMAFKLVLAAADATEDQDVVTSEFEFESQDPLMEVPIAVTMRGPVPSAGVYYLQLHCKSVGALIERRIVIREKKQKTEE